MIQHITETERALTAKVADLTAEVTRLTPLQFRQAPCYKFCESNAYEIGARQAELKLSKMTAERDSLKADAEKWRAREARNKALIDRGFLGSPLRATS